MWILKPKSTPFFKWFNHETKNLQSEIWMIFALYLVFNWFSGAVKLFVFKYDLKMVQNVIDETCEETNC